MSTMAVATMMKMIESLPEMLQNKVLDHLREYVEELQDELEWDRQFQRTQPGLIAAARRAKQEIAQGHAEPFDYNQL
jgi:hypothetical protein